MKYSASTDAMTAVYNREWGYNRLKKIAAGLDDRRPGPNSLVFKDAGRRVRGKICPAGRRLTAGSASVAASRLAGAEKSLTFNRKAAKTLA